MKISVVIPLYNKENHIARAIQSVLSQKYTDWECIVVDDGSTDGGPRIVESFQDARITLVNQKNAGVSSARNTGCAYAKSDWVALLDADDYWMEDHLLTLMNLISSYPSCNVVSSNFWYETSDGDRQIANKYKIDHDSSVEDYFRFVVDGNGSLIHCSAAAVKKSLWIEVDGFPECYRLSEDAFFWCQLAFKGKFAVAHRPTAVYFQDLSGNSTRSYFYVGDAPFVNLRNAVPHGMRLVFEEYLALARMEGHAMGTLLAGDKKLLRRMAYESLFSRAARRAILMLALSVFPSPMLKLCLRLYRKVRNKKSIFVFKSVTIE